MSKFTPKQKRFIEEYLIDLNVTQAAIRAGYSPDTAKDIGCQNLAKLNISAAISRAMAERSRRTGINQDRVIMELARIAFANIADFTDIENGAILPHASPDDTAAIQSVKVKNIPTKDGGEMVEREIRLYDKIRALELLGKHLGMWNDKMNLSVNLPVFIKGEDQLAD